MCAMKTKDNYCEILEINLNIIYDNDPQHTSKLVQKYLQYKNIKVLLYSILVIENGMNRKDM